MNNEAAVLGPDCTQVDTIHPGTISSCSCFTTVFGYDNGCNLFFSSLSSFSSKKSQLIPATVSPLITKSLSVNWSRGTLGSAATAIQVCTRGLARSIKTRSASASILQLQLRLPRLDLLLVQLLVLLQRKRVSSHLALNTTRPRVGIRVRALRPCSPLLLTSSILGNPLVGFQSFFMQFQ